jgi:cyclophilin family peptidyl-prolyl cis-trans isomerase/HEAT repeat protein
MPSSGSRLAVLVALLLAPRAGASQTTPVATVGPTALQRLLNAEDARGGGPGGLEPLMSALRGADTLLRRLAIRGLGRLQRPELGRILLPSLDDHLPAIRAEAANAIAQSLRRVRRDAAGTDPAQLTARAASAALRRALASEPDPRVAGILGQSLGRLPLPDSGAAREAEAAIRSRMTAKAAAGLVHGMYTLARARKATGNLEPASVALLRRAAVLGPDTTTRRLALLTLAVAGGLDSTTALRAMLDQDDETRRMVLRGAGALSPSLRASLVRRGLRDESGIVRTEAVAATRLGSGPPDCAPILAATRDRDPYVVLTAIDSLAGGCKDPKAAAAALRRIASRKVTAGPPDHRWQAGAHALLALARLDRASAAAMLPSFAKSPRSEMRQYSARAGGVIGARTVLYHLAADPDRNVQEAAIAALAVAAGHEADSVYLRALGSRGNQVVLAAATALEKTREASALPALLDALDRLSAGRTENARDPRVAVLQRIGELGSAASAPRLRTYLADYDTTVATMAAGILARWTGDSAAATPAPLAIRAEPLGEVFLRSDIRLRVAMAPSSGGGSFTVRLFPREAPATVARVLRLVRERFYDGKVFQRVEPNFVIQGGGPDANEYVGDSTFMRDELTWLSHARGTIGISARGRDTGDGQWFINLVDNPLLDHEYTVFGRIDSGRPIAERILEGDRIERVEVIADR